MTPLPSGAWRRAREYYRRHGLRRTLERVLAEIEAVRQRRASRSALKPVVAENGPGVIRAHIDTPREGASEGSSFVVVSGWAYSPGRETSVEVYVERGARLKVVAAGPRPDVATFEGTAEAVSSGFSLRVPISDLESGRHVLQVVFRDDAGHVRVLMPSFERIEPGSMYHAYYVRSLPTASELGELEAGTAKLAPAPKIHFVVVADGNTAALAATVDSIAEQTYPSWAGTVYVEPDGIAAAEQVLARSARDLGSHWNIVSDANEAIPAGVTEVTFIAFMHVGETLSPGALHHYARAATRSDADRGRPTLVYSDHDAVARTGRHVRPWFVPEWSPDRLLCQDYVGGIYLVHGSEPVRAVVSKHLATGSPAWRYPALLEMVDRDDDVAHIPRVLWSRPDATTDAAPHAEAERAAVEAALARIDPAATVETDRADHNGAIRRISWSLPRTPRVSIIVPTTGRLDLVSETLDYLATRTDYPDLEIIFLDNSRGLNPDGIELLRASVASVIECDEAFNWAKLNNDGARASRGELLLFLNDDLTVADHRWLDRLVRQAMRPGIGVVGSLLTYPDGRIQHAGVMVVGHGGGAAHLLHGLGDEDDIYLDLHAVTREVSAVTGACMMVTRAAFDEVGGFDEGLAVIGNDVDFCLRVAATGRRTLWTPQPVLVHRESASRSDVDHTPDEGRMWQRWSGELLSGDPYYNPNLAQDRVDCGLDWARVEDRPDPVEAIDPAHGVNLVGYIRAEMGIGEATRGEAQALTDVAVPFVIIDHQHGNPARMQDRSWLHRVVEEPLFATNILHVNADVLPVALSQLPDGLLEGRRNIGYWTWELPRFPSRWHESFDLVDEVWVPTAFVRDAVGADAPVPVHVVPHAVRTPGGPFLGRGAFGLPEGPYQFLAMYDTQSVKQRKNPHGAVEAFRRAFGDDEDASLVLKVNSGGLRELDELRELTARRPNVHIVSDVLTRTQVDSLVACSDAFVSLHRSEGFGLPIAEAMALGKPVVATGWSGNMDFMSDETAACVAYRIVELEGTYGPYDAGQHWAEPDLEDAASWMARLREDPRTGQAMGARAAAAIRVSNGSRAVGEVMARRLG